MAKKFTNPLPQNELTGSVFFASPPQPPSALPTTSTPPAPASNPDNRDSERPNERTVARTNARPEEQYPPLSHRRTKRYSFEFYDDQLVALKKLRFEAEMRGENIPMSEMVRQAVDDYLKRQ